MNRNVLENKEEKKEKGFDDEKGKVDLNREYTVYS